MIYFDKYHKGSHNRFIKSYIFESVGSNLRDYNPHYTVENYINWGINGIVKEYWDTYNKFNVLKRLHEVLEWKYVIMSSIFHEDDMYDE